MTASEIALFAFTACNTLRVFAYVPQIVKIARDNSGASAISYTTWGLFGASHLSTVTYAVMTLNDWKLAFIFCLNALACAAILGLTVVKRLAVRRVERTQKEVEDASSLTSSDPSYEASCVGYGLVPAGRDNGVIAVFPGQPAQAWARVQRRSA